MVDIGELRALFEVDAHPLLETGRRMSNRGALVLEELAFQTETGEAVRGFLMRPKSGGRVPAVLHIHAHGNRYDIGAVELLEGRSALAGPPGHDFAARGFAVLSIDMPGFGTRAGSESALAKARLWHGRSLAGQMLGEQASALGWLAAQDFVRADRIGVYGISMGATLGYWLAAVDPRVACVAHLCCYADFDGLIETGAHDLHGIYLTIPGLLDRAANGEIAGMVAPRPQLICIGDRDPLTPPEAVDRALVQTRLAYEAAGAADRLLLHREPEGGHRESAAMRRAVLDFFASHLSAD